MKKVFKIGALALLVLATVIFSGCGKKLYKGDYHYKTEAETCGVRVEVRVENGIIKAVRTLESKYGDPCDFEGAHAKYLAHQDEYLRSFEGKSVEEVLSYVVSCEEGGSPVQISAPNLAVVYDAPRCSGGLLLAVQNALSKIRA